MVTTQDLESFARFARPLINSGKAESLSQVLQKWEAQREHEQAMDDIREGIADAEAGCGRAAEDVFADVRVKLGLPR